MFYSNQILARKGPLGLVWIAAHMDKQLKRQQVNSTSIPASVDTLLDPEVPLALRLSGQLLLGVVRIYARKVCCNATCAWLRRACAVLAVHALCAAEMACIWQCTCMAFSHALHCALHSWQNLSSMHALCSLTCTVLTETCIALTKACVVLTKTWTVLTRACIVPTKACVVLTMHVCCVLLQVAYLQQDCDAALVKISVALRAPDTVNLPPGSQAAPLESITLIDPLAAAAVAARAKKARAAKAPGDAPGAPAGGTAAAIDGWLGPVDEHGGMLGLDDVTWDDDLLLGESADQGLGLTSFRFEPSTRLSFGLAPSRSDFGSQVGEIGVLTGGHSRSGRV